MWSYFNQNHRDYVSDHGISQEWFRLGADITDTESSETDFRFFELSPSSPDAANYFVHLDLAGHSLTWTNGTETDDPMFLVGYKTTLSVDDSVGGGTVKMYQPL